jgi:hypothetical protein
VSATPLIPLRLFSRPSKGDIIVPWASDQPGEDPERADLRTITRFRAAVCWLDLRCWMCGEILDLTYVFLGTETNVGQLWFDRPALHPECAQYVLEAYDAIMGRSLSDGERIYRVMANGYRITYADKQQKRITGADIEPNRVLRVQLVGVTEQGLRLQPLTPGDVGDLINRTLRRAPDATA